MSKYAPLEDHLRQQDAERVPTTFAEIEKIINGKLPPSARKHRAWWSNNSSNSAITEAWINAGYKSAEVDMAGETLVFVRRPLPPPKEGRELRPEGGDHRRVFTGAPIMSKYSLLEDHLRQQDAERVQFTFAEIERIIQDDLPPSARRHRAWWANKPANSAIAHAWFSAGYKSAAVDMGGETLVFVRFAAPRPKNRRKLLGCLSEFTTVVDGYDLTRPTVTEWEMPND